MRANSSTGSVGRGHMWLPLVHVHVVHGSPEIVGAANSICSERVSSFCRHCMVWLVGGSCVGSDMGGWFHS